MMKTALYYYSSSHLCLLWSSLAILSADAWTTTPLVTTHSDSRLCASSVHNTQLFAVVGPEETANRRGFLSTCLARTSVATSALVFLPTTIAAAEEEVVEAKKEEISQLLTKDESDEVKVEQETEALITKLEEAPNDTATAKKLIVQLEKDEEIVEKETEQLIEQLESLEAVAEASNVAILPEPDAKTPEAAAAASAAETKEFIAALQDRSASTDAYIGELKQQVDAVTAAKAKGTGLSTDFLRVLKDRVVANGDFLAKYDDFVARWKDTSR